MDSHRKYGMRIIAFLFLLLILTASCSTRKYIPYSQVCSQNTPTIIRLNDNSEYKIYSVRVKCKTSGDSLIIYDKKNLTTFEVIPEPSISELIKDNSVKYDSFLNSYFFGLLIDALLEIILW